MIAFSIIIPIYNESKNIDTLISEIFLALKDINNFELILINDGSTDSSKQVLEKIKKKYLIKIINLDKNQGQSFAIWQGIKKSKYNNIVTMDGDGQNNPKDINKLIKLYFSDLNLSLVGGIRKKRRDTFVKIYSSKIANFVRSKILNDDCIDTGCSLKIFKKDVFLTFPFFNGIHRFLPALFKGYGKKTFFVDVDHRPRNIGISKYGTFDRLFKGVIDIFRVLIILYKYNKKNV
tara:strand:- start:1625 stop:2326 length:702 start_codon:yes stop_codon:yes gene_type:complete